MTVAGVTDQNIHIYQKALKREVTVDSITSDEKNEADSKIKGYFLDIFGPRPIDLQIVLADGAITSEDFGSDGEAIFQKIGDDTRDESGIVASNGIDYVELEALAGEKPTGGKWVNAQFYFAKLLKANNYDPDSPIAQAWVDLCEEAKSPEGLTGAKWNAIMRKNGLGSYDMSATAFAYLICRKENGKAVYGIYNLVLGIRTFYFTAQSELAAGGVGNSVGEVAESISDGESFYFTNASLGSQIGQLIFKPTDDNSLWKVAKSISDQSTEYREMIKQINREYQKTTLSDNDDEKYALLMARSMGILFRQMNFEQTDDQRRDNPYAKDRAFAKFMQRVQSLPVDPKNPENNPLARIFKDVVIQGGSTWDPDKILDEYTKGKK